MTMGLAIWPVRGTGFDRVIPRQPSMLLNSGVNVIIERKQNPSDGHRLILNYHII